MGVLTAHFSTPIMLRVMSCKVNTPPSTASERVSNVVLHDKWEACGSNARAPQTSMLTNDGGAGSVNSTPIVLAIVQATEQLVDELLS